MLLIVEFFFKFESLKINHIPYHHLSISPYMSSNELNSMDFFAGLQGSTMLETSLLLAHVPVHDIIFIYHSHCTLSLIHSFLNKVSFLLVRATSGNVVNEAVCVLGLLLIAFTVLSTRHDPSRLADNPLSAIQVSWRAERLLAPETAAMPLRLVLSLAVLLVIALVSHLSRRTLAIRRGALSDSARPVPDHLKAPRLI